MERGGEGARAQLLLCSFKIQWRLFLIFLGWFPVHVPSHLFYLQGIKLADHVLAVNQQDTTTMEHQQVVQLIRNSGDVVTLTVISKAPLFSP